MPKEIWLIIFAGSFTLLGAGIVAGTNLFNTRRERVAERKRHVSKGFLDESLLLLERAYETFTRCGNSPPKNDRDLWLSTARMIVRFQNMRQRLTEPEHCDIADEHEEYWRLRFYTLLEENSSHFTAEYFLPRGGLYNPDSIGRKSVAVIFDFTKWKEGMSDPLESVNDKELFAGGAVSPGFHGVISYLKQDQGYWSDIERLSESWDDGS